MYRMLFDECYGGITDIPDYWHFRFLGKDSPQEPSATQYLFYQHG